MMSEENGCRLIMSYCYCLVYLLWQLVCRVSVTGETHQVVQESRVCLLCEGASCQPHADFPAVTDGVTVDMDSVPLHPEKTCVVASQSAHTTLILTKVRGAADTMCPNLLVAALSIHIRGGSENFGITLYF